MTDDRLRSAIEERIRAHDRDGAVAVALRAVTGEGVALEDLHDVLAALLVDVGAAWQAGELPVWREHEATAVARTIVEACAPLLAERAAPPAGRTVVLATPSEEFHDLGLRMLADRFVLAGWTAHLLGASLPVEELIDAIDELDADAVALSASTHYHRLRLRRALDALLATRHGLQVWVGGAAFAADDGWADAPKLDPAHVPYLAGGAGGC